MKKLFTLLLLSNLLIFTDNKNDQSTPNQSILHNDLPIETLEYIFKEYSKDLSSDKSKKFRTFLKIREEATKTNGKNIKINEEILLTKLIANYHSNRQNLSSYKLATCAFAHSLHQLRTCQIIAEMQAYPKGRRLTFELFPARSDVSITLKSSMPVTDVSLILKTTKKRWISFLLQRLTKR